jgi:eukaryotic-like serine/threonine-protein kinase
MGRVLLAASDEDGGRRLVALKEPYATEGGECARALLRESDVRVRHVNAVPIEEVCGPADAPYGVMPYVEGVTLGKLLGGARRHGVRLSVGVVARIALDTLSGLGALHELRGSDDRLLGVVHRDVKPQNVLVGTDGVSRLIDFGLAGPPGMELPRARVVMGNLSYMAPEQLCGQAVDARTDIFALGVIMWEALAGRRLFASDEAGRAMHRVRSVPIPALDGTEPRAVALLGVCRTALEHDASRRHPSARAMADAVRVAIGEDLAEPKAVARCVASLASRALATVRALSNRCPVVVDEDPTIVSTEPVGVRPW